MREILFRGKRVDNGEWTEGFYVKCRGHSYILPVYDMDHGFDERYSEWIEADPETICKYTGLKDKNGRKIFEGDVVKGVAYSTDFIGYIIWIDTIAGFGVRYFNKHREPTAWENLSILKAIQRWKHPNEFQAEIIGNIFDNPDLICT